MLSLVNESSYRDLDLTLIANALNIQATGHWNPAWLQHVPNVSPHAGHTWTMHFVDEDKQVPGALAYHDDANAIPDAVVMVKTILQNKGTYYGPGGVAAAASHEWLEMNGDLWCNDYAINWDDGYAYAKEMCDPIEGYDYSVTALDVNHRQQIVYLSNFVRPAWFNNGARGPFDFMGVLAHPFELRNGYAIRMRATKETQVQGEIPPGHGYRSMRRLVPNREDQLALLAGSTA